MIKLDFVEPNSEDWRTWVTECECKRDELVERRTLGEDPEISDLYKDERMKQVYLNDGPPFYGKCAYCESRILGNQPGDIEHFRPKNRVTHESGEVVMVTDASGAVVKHPGYYWLAYDWRNLLYACADCNRVSSFKTGGVQVGKWDKFPVEGEHASAPEEELNERPLLLNPLIDDPGEDLSIDETGIMADRTEKGKTSIRILGLNLRESLIKDRADAIEQTTTAILALAVACYAGNVADQHKQLAKLRDVMSGAAPFAMARRFALIRSKSCFAPFLQIFTVNN